jgi:glycine dehydrogenase
MDYGFHAPTMSWPVPGTLMIEPTESEDLQELDRFVWSFLAIRAEIQDIMDGKVDPKVNLLKVAPFTLKHLMSEEWPYSFSRKAAGYPAPW